jgi:hypothetical protein
MFTEGTETNFKFKELKHHFEGKCIEEDFQLYNILEKTILEIDLLDSEKKRVDEDKMKI